jgi:hypothetical protein
VDPIGHQRLIDPTKIAVGATRDQAERGEQKCMPPEAIAY